MVCWIAWVWGFAEATLFFIVPDVGLSLIALRGGVVGWWACFWALLGALLGGAWMFRWGQKAPHEAERAVRRVPAIPARDIERVRRGLARWGIAAMLFGPALGIPYKIYAVYASRVTDLGRFLLVSVPARGVRFALVVWATPWLMTRWMPEATYTQRAWVVLALWGVLYLGYFLLKRERKSIQQGGTAP